MNEEPEPDQLIQEPKPYYSVTYWLVYTVVIFVVIALLGALGTPHLIRSKKKSYQSEAISNSKLLSLALYEFDSNFGSYPNDETIKEVNEAFPNHGYDLSGTSSNAAFRQLLAAGILKNEEIIQKGKCNFAYVANQSTSGNPNRPILLSPVIPGTNKFNSKDGIILVLKIDNSVSSYKIGKAGEIYDNDGLDILSASHPIWKGKAPDIRYPE